MISGFVSNTSKKISSEFVWFIIRDICVRAELFPVRR